VTAPEYWFVAFDVAEDEAEDRGAEMFELGATGVEQRDAGTLVRGEPGKVTLVVSFESRAEAEAALASIDAGFGPRIVRLEGDAWRDEYKKYFHPFRICAGVVIRPPWEEVVDVRPDEKVLILEPGRAFGTGLHETTSLVCEIVSRLTISAAVLDVGCGSGILGLVAIVLGASRVRALDVDADAIAVAKENAQRNGLADRVEADTADVTNLTGTWPLVLANIEASVLVPMAPALSARLAPGGHLVLSGILATQEADVRAAYTHLEHVETRAKGEWIALAYRSARDIRATP
jgi:ribosomal protein L11 methyltransferase